MDEESKLAGGPATWPKIIKTIRERTPARIFVERGASFSTQMELELRAARADAVDAVWTDFEMEKDFPGEFVAKWKLFQVTSQAATKSEFLLRPDLGRKLSESGRKLLGEGCGKNADLQIVMGDGLSGAALAAQTPALFPLLQKQAETRGWSVNRSFVVRHCRVGIMNEIGELLAPKVLVLLIGERPGLATAISLSAYMAYGPKSGHTDAERNLISNIQGRGVAVEDAAERIVRLAGQMMKLKRSGTALKEGDARLEAGLLE
jgi:ethanolamine ammonia-lyase small subunit